MCLALLGWTHSAAALRTPPAPSSPPASREPVPAEEGEGDDGAQELPAAGRIVPRGEYRSPYSLKFSVAVNELLFDRDEPRGKVDQQSSIPRDRWDSAETRRRWGAWGPPARKFDCPERVREWSAQKKRERVLATAARHIGRDYQHHHIPDWNPPKDWPWKQCCTGHNSPGIDCSNFSSWNYNWALGMHMSSAIGAQSKVTRAQQGGRDIPVHRIERPSGFKELCAALKTGDLLFIKGKADGNVTHVIMWVGACGVAPDGAALVIDSTGSGHKDSNGVAIPSGVHLRPFTEDSWYFRCFSHAHRMIADEAEPAK
jgi:cell wall-associated NlpC family hydrolase